MVGDESVSGGEEIVEEQTSQSTEPVESEESQQAAGEGEAGEGQDGQGESEDQSESRPKPRRKPNQAERRALRAERERDRLLDVLLQERGGGKPQAEQKAKPAGLPKQADYENYEDYIDARVAYRADQVVEQRLQTARQDSQKAQQARTQRDLEQAYHQRVDEARDQYEDFDEVAYSDDVQITAVMRDALVESEFGPHVQYYLGDNPDEAAKIAALSPTAQIRAIGRLETRFANKAEEKSEAGEAETGAPARKTTSAPPPVKAFGGKKASGNVHPDKLDINEWMKREAEGTLNY